MENAMKKLPAILILLVTVSSSVHAASLAPGAAAQTSTPGSTGTPQVVPAAPATTPDTGIQPNVSPGVNPNSDTDNNMIPTDVLSTDGAGPPAQGS